MKKWYLTLILLSLLSVSFGQISKNDKVAVLQGSPPHINIIVCDGETGALLERATVKLIIAPGDTACLISDRLGSVNYSQKVPRDSLGIIINYLGYEELRYVHKFSIPYINLIARLKADSLNINAIIIKGEQIAMVIQGDTTIYNASAFKTMKGDPLSVLLKKLPGVEFRDGNVYANGQIVRRILVNGTPIFANYANRAFELLSAGEVAKVKVYDEHSAKDIALGDTIKPKERVLDVSTKKKTNIVQQVSVKTLAGVYPVQNDDKKYETLYSAQGQYDRHIVGNNLMAMTGYGEKSSFSGNPTGVYNNDLSGILILDKSPEDYKYHIQSNTILTGKRNTTYSNIKNEFFPTQEYYSREELNEMTSGNRTTSLQSRNMFSYNIKKRHRFSLQIDVTGDYSHSGNSVYNDIVLNGAATYRSNMVRDDRNKVMSFNLAAGYKYKFAKPGRDLNVKISHTAVNGEGNGWSIDTLTSSTQKIDLYNDQNTRKNNLRGELSFTEPLTKKTNISLGYVIESIDEKSTKASIERITGLPDRNSFDYTQGFFRQNISVRYIYRSSNLNINTGLALQSLRQELDNKLPEDLFRSGTYTNLLPAVSLSYTKLPNLVELNYSENVTLPSLEQLRGMLDTYDAPFYLAGNPYLKESVVRAVNVKYSVIDFESFSSWAFNAKAVFTGNAPVIKEEFFTENTVKPEYNNFEFPAGSILQTTENANGRFTVGFNADYSTKSKLLRSKISASLFYSYDKVPCYAFDILQKNNMHTAGLNVGLISDFSEKVELTFFSQTVFGNYERQERDYNQILRRINETVRGGIRYNFSERLWFCSEGSYMLSNSSLPGTSLKKMILNTEISYKFGDNYTNAITLAFNDIFNQNKSLDVMMQNNYIQTRHVEVLGRNLYLKLLYCF